jgi:hypothetical protein
MKVRDITERVQPDQDFMAKFSDAVDEALAEYQDFLQSNDDVDDIDELASYLDAELGDPDFDDLLNININVDHDVKKTDWWMTAEAAGGETEDGDRVYEIDINLNAKNMEGVYGPKTFKKIIMRLISHEMIHINQYQRVPDLGDLVSGYQKSAADGGRHWETTYLRDPHELMAFADTLSQEMLDTDDPQAALRNPDAYRELLPTWARFRRIFTKDTPQIRALLKYTSQYLNKNF